MAEDKPRATRREPVTTKAGGVSFKAVPLPWQKRNDLGDAVVAQYSLAFNNVLRSMRDENDQVIGIEGALFETGLDYPTLFLLAYSTYEYDEKTDDLKPSDPPVELRRAFKMLDFEDMLEVLVGALKANGLDRLEHMLDPDRKKGPATGESASPAETSDGQKTELPSDSGSPSPAGQEAG